MPNDDDKKTPPKIPHKDYGGRSTPVRGTPRLPSVIIERTMSVDRSDPTPPPVDRPISNEDLAQQVYKVAQGQVEQVKVHETFAVVTTQRLAVVEARVERVPEVEKKVDKLLLLSAEKNQKQEILAMDITSAHVEVGKQKQISEIRNAEDEKAAARKIKIEKWKLASKLGALIGAGIGLGVEILHRMFG